MTEYDVLVRVGEIYEQNEWSRIEDVKGEIFSELFEFCKEIPEEALEVVFQLLENFLVIREYRRYANSIMRDIIPLVPPSGKVFVLPVRDPKDTENSSANLMVYEVMAFRPSAHAKTIVQFDTPFSEAIELTAQDIVVFVDDFVGSGRQFEKMFKVFSVKHKPMQYYLKTICIMNAGKTKVESFGVAVSSHHVLPKALSDGSYVKSHSIAEAGALYDDIESKIDISTAYKRGSDQSEALVALKRTPNNTLPIFWRTTRKGGQKWPAPFPRV